MNLRRSSYQIFSRFTL